MPVWGVILIAIAVGIITWLLVSRKPAIPNPNKGKVKSELSEEEKLQREIKTEKEEGAKLERGLQPEPESVDSLLSNLRILRLKGESLRQQITNKELRKKVADVSAAEAKANDDLRKQLNP